MPSSGSRWWMSMTPISIGGAPSVVVSQQS
jgi:hypothetical protein